MAENENIGPVHPSTPTQTTSERPSTIKSALDPSTIIHGLQRKLNDVTYELHSTKTAYHWSTSENRQLHISLMNTQNELKKAGQTNAGLYENLKLREAAFQTEVQKRLEAQAAADQAYARLKQLNTGIIDPRAFENIPLWEVGGCKISLRDMIDKIMALERCFMELEVKYGKFVCISSQSDNY